MAPKKQSENLAEKARRARNEAQDILNQDIHDAKARAQKITEIAKAERNEADIKSTSFAKAQDAAKKATEETIAAEKELKHIQDKVNEDHIKSDIIHKNVEKDKSAVRKAIEDQKAKRDAINKAAADQLIANDKAIEAKNALNKIDQEYTKLIAKLSADKMAADKIAKNVNADKTSIQKAKKARSAADKALAKAIQDKAKANNKARFAAIQAENDAKKAKEAAQKIINDARKKLVKHESAEKIASDKVKADRDATIKAQAAKIEAERAATRAKMAKSEADKTEASARQAQAVAEKIANDAKSRLHSDEQAAKKALLLLEADIEAAKKAEENKIAKEIAAEAAKNASEKAKNAKDAAEKAAIAAAEKVEAANKVAEKADKALADLKGITWPKSTMTDGRVVRAFVHEVHNCWARVKNRQLTSKADIIHELTRILYKIFDMCDIPHVKAEIYKDSSDTNGLFTSLSWTMRINENILNSITPKSFYNAVETIYHEGRHVEQSWLICVQTNFEQRQWNTTQKKYEVPNNYKIVRYTPENIFNKALDVAVKRKKIPIDSSGNMSKYYTYLLELIKGWSKSRNTNDTRCIYSNVGKSSHWHHRYQLLPMELDAFLIEENLRNEFLNSKVPNNDLQKVANDTKYTCRHCGGKNYHHLMSNIPVAMIK